MFFLFSLIKEGLPRISPMVSIAPLAIYHPMRGKRGGGGMVKISRMAEISPCYLAACYI